MTHNVRNWDAKAIGRRIKQLQNAKKMTNADMASLPNISEIQYSKLIRGRNMFSQDKLLVLHNELGVSVDYILTGEMSVGRRDKMDETEYSIYLGAIQQYIMGLPEEESHSLRVFVTGEVTVGYVLSNADDIRRNVL